MRFIQKSAEESVCAWSFEIGFALPSGCQAYCSGAQIVDDVVEPVERFAQLQAEHRGVLHRRTSCGVAKVSRTWLAPPDTYDRFRFSACLTPRVMFSACL